MEFSPNIAPQQYQDEQAIQRQRALAQALMQNSMGSMNPNQTAGGVVVKNNPWGSLANLAAALVNKNSLSKLDTKEGDLNKQYADILKSKFTGTSEVPDQSSAMGTPIGTTPTGAPVKIDGNFTPEQINGMKNEISPQGGTSSGQGSMTMQGMTPDQALTAYSLDPQGYMKNFTDSHGLPMQQLQSTIMNEQANRDVTMRGQDLTNARDVERNHLMYGMGSGISGGLAPEDENYAQMIATGKAPFPTGAALKNPRMLNIVNRVNEINPNFSAANYQVGLNNEKQFTDGKLGSTVRSLNVANSHLDTLGKLSDALNNGDVQLFNKLGNEYSLQTGHPAPANFDAAKQIIGDEIVKAVVGSGGGVGDRDKAQEALSSAKSPQQLKGVIDTYKKLFGGQLDGLRRQYESSTTHGDFNRFLSGETKQETGAPAQNILKYNPATGKLE